MRARSAYISSVGTTTILIAAALFMLGVVSALVAFRGWPGTAASEGVTSVPLEPPRRAAGFERAPAVREARVRPVGARRVAVAARELTTSRASTVGLVKVPAMRRPDDVGLLVNSPISESAPAAPAPPPAAPRTPEPPAAAPETPDLPLPEPTPELDGFVTDLVAETPPVVPQDTVDVVMGLGEGVVAPR